MIMGKERGIMVEKGCVKFYAFDEEGKRAICELIRNNRVDWDMKFIDSDIVMAVAFYYNPKEITSAERKKIVEELIESFRNALTD